MCRERIGEAVARVATGKGNAEGSLARERQPDGEALERLGGRCGKVAGMRCERLDEALARVARRSAGNSTG
jgi:hypothetical protein